MGRCSWCMYIWSATNVRMPFRVSNTGEGEKSQYHRDTHCTIHRQALIMRTAPEEFNKVFAVVIKAVNFIKASALNPRLFSEICKEN